MLILVHLDDRPERILRVQLDDFRGLSRVQPDERSQREHGELLDQALQRLRREHGLFLRHQLPDRFMRHETLPVRTRMEERLEGVSEADDLRILVNLRPLKSTRISLPAQPFVLLQDQVRDPVGVPTQLPELLGARLRMSFDEVPFLGGQRARLVQDVLRHQAHPNVMEDCRHPQSHEILARILQPHPDLDREDGRVDQVRDDEAAWLRGDSLDKEPVALRERIDEPVYYLGYALQRERVARLDRTEDR